MKIVLMKLFPSLVAWLLRRVVFYRVGRGWRFVKLVDRYGTTLYEWLINTEEEKMKISEWVSWTGLLSVVICKGKLIINREIESVTDSEVSLGECICGKCTISMRHPFICRADTILMLQIEDGLCVIFGRQIIQKNLSCLWNICPDH